MSKYLGQHFLINKNKLRKIVETLNLQSKETIIEIGPGHGELTDELKVNSLKLKVVAIEKDKKFVQLLQKKFAFDKNIEIIEGDALKILQPCVSNLSARGGKSYKLVGNIPYYITGYLLRIIAELENKPSLIVLTIQKEVAQRICAQPPKMNLLAASVQFWAEPEIVSYISKKDFRPMPRVDSAIIKLTPKNQNLTPEIYYKLIKILFKQPRKTIFNNFCGAKKTNADECRKKLLKAGINPSDRPQNLNLEQIRNLSI